MTIVCVNMQGNKKRTQWNSIVYVTRHSNKRKRASFLRDERDEFPE